MDQGAGAVPEHPDVGAGGERGWGEPDQDMGPTLWGPLVPSRLGLERCTKGRAPPSVNCASRAGSGRCLPQGSGRAQCCLRDGYGVTGPSSDCPWVPGRWRPRGRTGPGLCLQGCTVRLSLTTAFPSPIATQLLQQGLQHQEGTQISLVLLRHRGDCHAGLISPLLPQAAAWLYRDRLALHQILHVLLRGHRHG